MTLPIIFLQHKAYRWSPQVPAWKTADLRGTSCLINSSHKQECFPCTDWYTPPFASLASRDVRHCTSRAAERYGNYGSKNLLKHRISLGSFSRRRSPFFMWQYLNPPPHPPSQLRYRPFRHPWAPMTLWVSPEEDAGDEGHARRQNLTRPHRDAWKLLRDFMLWWRSRVQSPSSGR